MVRRKQLFSGGLGLVLLASLPAVVSSQGPAGATAQARAIALKQLLSSIEGVRTESARTHTTKEGYLRFIMAPPSTFFPVAGAENGMPQDVANAFLQQWSDLFANRSQALRFNVIRVTSTGPRTYLRYRQTYADLEVFRFDKKTGQFTDEATGKPATAQEALVLKRQ